MESTFQKQRTPGVPEEAPARDLPASSQPDQSDVLAADMERVFAEPVSEYPEAVMLPEEQRKRILKMFSALAPLVAGLTEELCKEDHTRFMNLAARVEALCIRMDAELAMSETTILSRMLPPKLGFFARIVAAWAGKFALIGAHDHAVRQVEHELGVIRTFRQQLNGLRSRPAKIHEQAVEHVRRLLMYEDSRYAKLEKLIADARRDVETAQRKNEYWDRQQVLKAILDGHERYQTQMDQEFRDKALQQIQESDNCPLRPPPEQAKK